MSQSYKNHIKRPWSLMIVFVLTLLVIVLSMSLPVSWHFTATVLLAIIVVFALGYTRMQLLMLQDRIIRLEMKVRFEQVLPEALLRQVDVLTLPQIIALRFAADNELAHLTEQVLDGKLQTPDSIKRAITSWNPDEMRI